MAELGDRPKSKGLRRIYRGQGCSPEEIEFIQALDAYRQKEGKAELTPVEILGIIKELGYSKLEKS